MDIHICYILISLWIFNTQSQERNRYERKTIKKRKNFEGFLNFWFIYFLDVVAEISKRENAVLAILLNTKKKNQRNYVKYDSSLEKW